MTRMQTEVEDDTPHAGCGPMRRTKDSTEPIRHAAQILADYRRHDPRRRLDWRWQRARDLLKDGEEPDPVYDDPWTRRAFEYQQYLVVDHPADALAEAMPDIHVARQLKEIGGISCWELEARILARETPQGIEVKTGIAAPVVKCYEKMFFSVCDRIDYITYIMAMAIGPRPFDGKDVAAIWNHFAYWCGPHFLDLVIDDFRETGKPDYSHLCDDRDWWKGRTGFPRTLDRLIALLMFKVDTRNFMALLRVQLAVMVM